MKEDFQAVCNKKDSQIDILTRENLEIRKLLLINKELGIPTQEGILS